MIFYRGQAVLEKRTGEVWYVTGVYHPHAPQGASLLCQKMHTDTLAACENAATVFKSHEVDITPQQLFEAIRQVVNREKRAAYQREWNARKKQNNDCCRV